MSSFKKQIPNLLSLSRVPFSFLVIYAITINDGWLFFLFAFVAALTDFLDGYLARKWRAISYLGIILDPIADKIGIGVIVITLYIYGFVPLWFLILILLKDFLILFGGLLLKYKCHVAIPPANWAGKLATFVIALSLVIHFYQVKNLIIIFQVLTALSILVVIFAYSRRYFIFKNNLLDV